MLNQCEGTHLSVHFVHPYVLDFVVITTIREGLPSGPSAAMMCHCETHAHRLQILSAQTSQPEGRARKWSCNFIRLHPVYTRCQLEAVRQLIALRNVVAIAGGTWCHARRLVWLHSAPVPIKASYMIPHTVQKRLAPSVLRSLSEVLAAVLSPWLWQHRIPLLLSCHP